MMPQNPSRREFVKYAVAALSSAVSLAYVAPKIQYKLEQVIHIPQAYAGEAKKSSRSEGVKKARKEQIDEIRNIKGRLETVTLTGDKKRYDELFTQKFELEKGILFDKVFEEYHNEQKKAANGDSEPYKGMKEFYDEFKKYAKFAESDTTQVAHARKFKKQFTDLLDSIFTERNFSKKAVKCEALISEYDKIKEDYYIKEIEREAKREKGYAKMLELLSRMPVVGEVAGILDDAYSLIDLIANKELQKTQRMIVSVSTGMKIPLDKIYEALIFQYEDKLSK